MKSLFSRRVWIALSTLVVVGFFFAYYFLIYIPGNEDSLVDEKFRALKRIGENFIGMKADLENSIDILVRDCQQDNEDSIAQITREMTRDYQSLSKGGKLVEMQKRIGALQKKCSDRVKESLSHLKIQPEQSFKPFWDPGASVKYRALNKENVFLKSYRYKTKLTDFITNPSLINNQFDRFLIFRILKNNSIAGYTAVIAYQGTGTAEVAGADNKIILSNIEGLFDSSQGLTTLPMRTLKISGVTSRIFPYVMEFNPDEDWVLCGLMKENDIQSESRSIELSAIIFLILILLFMLLSMPLLKLFIMNNIERLQVINVWFAGCSIVLGTALVTILFLVGHHFINYRNIHEGRLTKLSNSIKSSFTSEISSITTQMRSYAKNQVAIFKLESGQTGKQFYTQVEHVLAEQPTEFVSYPFFNEFLFLNDKGKVPIVLATHALPKSITLPDLSKRKYFTDGRDKNLTGLLHPGDTQNFAIQSIRSWTSGKNEAGVSISWDNKSMLKRDTIVVLATATKLKSVMDALLPPGYLFCIVNGLGDVLFHSDGNKNLQENFLEEIDQDYLSRAAIEGRLSQSIALTYSGKKHLAYIQPLDTKDMYLITLLDMDYYNTPIVLTCGFVWILTTILFIIQGAQILFLYCLKYKSSNLQMKTFFLNWLRPRGLGEDLKDYFQISYSQSITAMSMIAAVLSLVSIFNSSRYLAVTFLTLPVLLFTAHYYLLYKADADNNSRRHRNICLVFGILLFGIITLFAFLNIPVIARLRFIFLESVIILILIVNLFTNWLTGLHRLVIRTLGMFNLYTTFLCFWLFLVSILPIFYFYKATFHHEHFLWSKFIQWEAFKKSIAREEKLNSEFDRMDLLNKDRISLRDSLKETYLAESNKYGYYLFTDSTIVPYKEKQGTLMDLKNTLIEEIEFRLRPRFYGPMENSRYVLLNGQNAAKWYAKASRSNIFLNAEDKKIFYSSKIPTFIIFTGDYSYFFIVGFLLSLLGIHQIVRFCIKNIYGWRRVSGVIRNSLTLELLKTKLAAQENRPLRLFVVGLPFSGKSELLAKLTVDIAANDVYLSQGVNPSIDYAAQKLVIIHNFEHAININKELTDDRLKLIQGLHASAKAKVIISSTVQPELIFEILEVKIKRLVADKRNEEKDKSNIEKELAELRNSYRIWKNILSDFEIYFVPLKSETSDVFIKKELSIGNFLPRLKQNFEDDINVSKQEDSILEIEEMAQGYYHALWNSFSRLEKHMLYDLAKDSFVNMRDLSRIRLLILKGVVVMDDAPRLMNKSFNNFILSVVKEDEELEMTNELRRKGSWFSIQIILIITFVSITIFIALVQREILTSVDALVATVSGVIALLMRFSGVFNGAPSRDPK